jgi:hypothetical protein
MSEMTATRMMNVATTIKSNTMLDLSPTILYALAAPSTPEEVRTAVAEKVAAGRPSRRP